MRDYTNLAWPEGPFGAGQRPYGKPALLVAAFAVDWGRGPDPLPLAAATVYLRVRKHGEPQPVSGASLRVGFRATVTEYPGEVPQLLAVWDRALVRARRHALVLAGHHLANDLTRAVQLSPTPLRGADGVAAAWQTRSVQQRGMALMVDTASEARNAGTGLSLPLDPGGPLDEMSCCDRAQAALARCLAIGLAACVHAGRYRVEAAFPVDEVIQRVGWDLFTDPPAPAGSSMVAVGPASTDASRKERCAGTQ